MSLFDPIVLNETEQHDLVHHLTQPVVLRYLRMLAQNLASDILYAVPEDGESDSSFIRRQQLHRGSLAAINTLLSIKE